MISTDHDQGHDANPTGEIRQKVKDRESEEFFCSYWEKNTNALVCPFLFRLRMKFVLAVTNLIYFLLVQKIFWLSRRARSGLPYNKA